MLDRIVRLSVGNPVFVNLAFIIVVAAGLVSAARYLPREQFPEVSLDRVTVDTTFVGATAADVEELVTRPIEEALEDVGDVDEVVSLSSEGHSNVIVTFLAGKDLQDGRSEIEKAVASVEGLPEDAETPVVREMKLELPVASMAIVGDRAVSLVADRMAERLREIDGVALVSVAGAAEPRIFVDLDERKLQGLGLSADRVIQAIRSARASVPAGRVERRGTDIFVRTEHRLVSAGDVAKIPLGGGSQQRIRDVARVYETHEEPETLYEVDGRPAVVLTVGRDASADPLGIRDEMEARLPALQSELPPGLSLTLTSDTTEVIRDRLDTVASNAATGGLLVLLVIFWLSGLRQALLALWGMPVSYFLAAAIMGVTDISINVVSTFGLLIATGIIVDDAIVVIENVQRHMEMGKSRVQAAMDGAKEVVLPVSVAVLTTVFAFMPLTMVSGTMGRVMKILPLVVIFCLLGSLFEAIFILPGHLAEFAKPDAKEGRTVRLARRLKALYAPALDWCLGHRRTVMVGVAVGFVGLMGLATTMPFQFTAPGKPFSLKIEYEVSPGSDLETTARAGRRVLEVMEAQAGEEIRATTLRVGSSRDQQSGFLTTGANVGSLKWRFDATPELVARWPQVMAEVRKHLESDPEFGYARVKENTAGPPAGAAVTARIRGRDIAEINRAVADAKSALRQMDGVRDIRDNYGSGKETFRIHVDQDRAALYGLTESDVARKVRTAIEGTVAEEVSIDEQQVEIVVRYAGAQGLAGQGISNLLIVNGAGKIVRLDQVARVERTREVGFVRREDGQRTVSVLAEVDSDVITGLAAAQGLEAIWDDELQARYPDLTLSFGGEADEIRESVYDLPAAFALAIGLIYTAVALQFGSYIQPLVILAAVVFGLMGAVAGLFFLGYDLSLIALFGIVALAGIAVNDSIVMVDFINKKRAEGMPLREAVRVGAMDRLRPIVSTTLTTCLGLAPLAFGVGGKDEILAPMAVSISAGLGFATLLVLLVVPPLYLTIEGWRGPAEAD